MIVGMKVREWRGRAEDWRGLGLKEGRGGRVEELDGGEGGRGLGE